MCVDCDCCQCECIICRTSGQCNHPSGARQGSYVELCGRLPHEGDDHEYEMWYDPYHQI